MGRGSHGRNYFKIRRRKRKERLKRRPPINFKDVPTFNIADYSKEQYKKWGKYRGGEFNGKRILEQNGEETGNYITPKNTKPKKGRIPKNPSEDEIPPYLVGYCLKAKKQDKDASYCTDGCPISDYCESRETRKPGDPKIDPAYAREAFRRLNMISFEI